ncbi:LacI family DNA-binding transcriptional regulator [Paenibacillus abyssi]|uniref:LacI family transcriptional regulator n=1 Tax=Paenibacillus abyssi TaxID=1340531 RepID=A0A917LGF3_9BACL|nr:LacI family DNA-binding transcriptional regulator [Paenibacillus abyssi]GGG21100.1 LacI family transcriptional regulator [Paenibacillus abyssi]
MEEGPIRRKEVAKLAGVSEATVSRVLNGVGPIREETRKRVLEAAEQLNYVPSALAQQFARKKSGNLGVIIPFVPKVHLFSTYYFSEILSGIGVTAKKEGYDMLLMFLSPEEKRNYSRLFRMQKVDACIMLGTQDGEEERQALRELLQEEHPFCLVNQRFEGEAFPTIEADHVSGSYAATAHLIGQGCDRIAFLNGPLTYSNSADRYDGYRRALADNGISVNQDILFTGNYSRKSGYIAAPEIAGAIKDQRIDAVFAANDRMALGLLQGLREHGIEPGRDAALIGYDDSEEARYTDPQLSSVSVPFYEMGAAAVSKLIGQEKPAIIDTETGFNVEKLPVRLIPRASSLRYKPN